MYGSCIILLVFNEKWCVLRCSFLCSNE